MQIFIPLADMKKGFQSMDYKRLGTQRNETKYLLDILLKRKEAKKYKHNPLFKMWEPHVEFLQFCFNKCIEEWLNRGYKNTLPLEDIEEDKVVFPSWWGDDELHGSHRAALLYKDKDHYGKFGWTEQPRAGYMYVVNGVKKYTDSTELFEKKKAKKMARKAESEKKKESKKQKTKHSKKKAKESESESSDSGSEESE